jgi:hypothetical protein
MMMMMHVGGVRGTAARTLGETIAVLAAAI